MTCRRVPLAACLASCAALAVAGFSFFAQPPVAEAVVLAEAALDLGECAVGNRVVTLRIRNNSLRALEVNSVQEGCWPGCCLKFDQPLPVALPPGTTTELACLLRVASPGPFQLGSAVHVVGERLHVLTFRVTGTGVPAAAAPFGGATTP